MEPAKPQELLDFSTMFKQGTNTAIPARPSRSAQSERKPNWLLEIPNKIELTHEQLAERRYMDQRRWMSIEKGTDSIALNAAISIWNFLSGTPLSASDAEALIKQTPLPLPQLFKEICHKQGRKGDSGIFLKPSLPNSTQLSFESAATILRKSLKDTECAFVYQTRKHLLVLLGYDNTPQIPLEAYKTLSEIALKDLQFWFMMAATHQKTQPIIIKRWRDISAQLSTVWPHFFDIEDVKQGQQLEPTSDTQPGRESTRSCIYQFKLQPRGEKTAQ